MKNLLLIIVCAFLCIILNSCYGVNEKNSYISSISTSYKSGVIWTDLFNQYQPKDTTSKDVSRIIEEFKSQPFTTKIIYFEEEPSEYIGISENGRFIRYVYNKKIEDQVLDGLSSNLSDSEKMRIILRINAFIFNHLNKEGQYETMQNLKRDCDFFLGNKSN